MQDNIYIKEEYNASLCTITIYFSILNFFTTYKNINPYTHFVTKRLHDREFEIKFLK